MAIIYYLQKAATTITALTFLKQLPKRSLSIINCNKSNHQNLSFISSPPPFSSSSSVTVAYTTMSSPNNNSSTNDIIRANKQRLRKEIRSKLKTLSSNEISSQSQFVWDELYKLPQYKSANSVGLFLSMPRGEIHTDGACQQVLKDGKDLYVPRVGLDFELCDMDMIKVQYNNNNNKNDSCSTNNDDGGVDDEDEIFHKGWPRNKWGIPEAPSNLTQLAEPGGLDLIVVPGLGFDRDGARLGQGKGYYDRFITKMSDEKQGKKPFLIAVGLEPSFVDVEGGIPVNDHDCKMDMVILPQTGAMTTRHK